MTNKTTELDVIKSEVDLQLTDKENAQILLQTTFNGLDQNTARRAMIEGRVRGFSIRDFLEKNVYAIPFKSNYSLVTSIDYARKIGMRSGIVGKDAPIYEESDNQVVSCTVTVKKKVDDYIGDFTATVYFKEYSTGRNLWSSKPRTMIAKVAEMHALRMACPEEMAQMFSEEEMEREEMTVVKLDIESYHSKLESAKDLDELKRVWAALPGEARAELDEVKDAMKAKFEPQVIDAEVIHSQAEPMDEHEQVQHAGIALGMSENEVNGADEESEMTEQDVQDIAKAFDGNVVDDDKTTARQLMEEGMKKTKAK